MFFFFKQKTAYEMRISDWSSDVCSSDLIGREEAVGADDLDHRPASGERDRHLRDARVAGAGGGVDPLTEVDLFREGNQVERVRLIIEMEIGRASCRERVCKFV